MGRFRPWEWEILYPWYPPGFAQGGLGLRVQALLNELRQQIPLGVLLPQTFCEQTFCPDLRMAAAGVAEKKRTRLVEVSAHHQSVPRCGGLTHNF